MGGIRDVFGATVGRERPYVFQHSPQTQVLFRVERFKWIAGQLFPTAKVKRGYLPIL
jgi:hypothetical protein